MLVFTPLCFSNLNLLLKAISLPRFPSQKQIPPKCQALAIEKQKIPSPIFSNYYYSKNFVLSGKHFFGMISKHPSVRLRMRRDSIHWLKIWYISSVNNLWWEVFLPLMDFRTTLASLKMFVWEFDLWPGWKIKITWRGYLTFINSKIWPAWKYGISKIETCGAFYTYIKQLDLGKMLKFVQPWRFALILHLRILIIQFIRIPRQFFSAAFLLFFMHAVTEALNS